MARDEQSGEPEPPMTRVLKLEFLGGGPVTAVVGRHQHRIAINHKSTARSMRCPRLMPCPALACE